MRRSRPKTKLLDARTARRLRAQLVARLRERLGASAPVEDLVHDALERLLRSRAGGQRDVVSRARRIADRLADKYEASLRRWRTEVSAHGSGPAEARVLAAPDSLELYELRVTHQCLLGAFGQLPIDARRLVIMHDLEEIPLKEIATMFGCGASSAKVRLQRARTRLSEICRAWSDGAVGSDGVLPCLPKEKVPASRRSPAASRRRGRKV